MHTMQQQTEESILGVTGKDRDFQQYLYNLTRDLIGLGYSYKHIERVVQREMLKHDRQVIEHVSKLEKGDSSETKGGSNES